MKPNSKLFIGMLALAAAATACTDSDDPSYEMSLQRNMLVTTANADATTAPRTTLTGLTIGMDMYNNTTGSVAVNNIIMPGGNVSMVSAAPLTYVVTSGYAGYLFQPQAGTYYTGIADPTTFKLYMGGYSQVNTRLEIATASTVIVGYGSTMYFFSSTNVSGPNGLVSTDSYEKNVMQVQLKNGDLDGQYQATLYWTYPVFDDAVSEAGPLAIDGLSVAIDPLAGTLAISGGADAPIVPKTVDSTTSTLGTVRSEYAVSNLTMSVGDLINFVGRLSFDLAYTPAATADAPSPATSTYRVIATLSESSAQ